MLNLNPTHDEDEEFVVIKAGPALPLRRPRPLKSNTIANMSPRPFPNHTAHQLQSHPHHKNGCPLFHQTEEHDQRHHNPMESQCQTESSASFFSPQPITSVSSSVTSVSKISSANSNSSTSIPTRPLISDISKTAKPTTLRSAPNPTSMTTTSPRSRSRSPSPSVTHCSTSTLKSRPSTPSLHVESKVKQYIEQVKKFDEEQRFKKGKLEKKDHFLSLEDLYQIPSTIPSEENNKEDHPQMEERLRETLRVIKEKDEIINKLRESCHDLKLKWADAENRIDEMRFGIGLGGASSVASPISGQQGRRSSLSMYGVASGLNSKIFMPQQQSQLPKRSTSEISLSHYPMHRGTNTEYSEPNVKGVDKATETDKEREEVQTGTDLNAVEVVESLNCSHAQTTNGDEDDELSPDFDLDLESRESQLDLVLEEKCSNWLEKIQNWKIDPNNTSLDIKDKDSCGDRDSGFRGSAELVLNSSQNKPSTSGKKKQKSATTSSATSKSTTRKQSTKPKGSKTGIDTFSPEQDGAEIEAPPPTDIHIMAAHFNQKQAQQEANASFIVEGGHGQNMSGFTTNYPGHGPSGPPPLQFSQPWNTFIGNVNPYSATDYEGFPSIYSSSSSSRLDRQQYSSYNSHASPNNHHRSISMDRLHTCSSTTDQFSHHAHRRMSSPHCDQRELFNRMDKRFQSLNPLLDSTIDIAMRLKEKTENLEKILFPTNAQAGVTVNVSVNNPPQMGSELENDLMNSNRFRRSRPKKILHEFK